MVPISTPPRAREIFEQALEIEDAVARLAWVAHECASDELLRRRVEELLKARPEAELLLPDVPAGWCGSEIPAERVGNCIGRYTLLERIGAGGCGVVYLAEQQHPVRRRVALKVIKAGMDSASVIARFEAERQAVALMDHPNIAKVFDAGSTETGRPYFVLELVEGSKITNYCAERQLSVNDRLHLFLQICDAVQHAHQKGIIHRDLKPSNILVTEKNNAPSAQVIDFGIAKAVHGKLTNETIHTGLHQFLGTPAYMSPEQADLSPDIDTRTDIYSLGVLLYELLVGRPPFDNHELLTAGLDAMRRIIRDVEPKRPSQFLVATRQSSIPSDLDWIAIKCLEKDRSRRYETVSALSKDIQRHLLNEPIEARPPSALYRFEKFVRRNKVEVTAAAAVVAALIIGICLASWQAIVANQQRARAEKRLGASIRFFNEAFGKVSPALGDVIGAAQPREQLARAAADVVDELAQGQDPTLEQRDVLAQLYQQLAVSHGWFTGNTSGDYETALRASIKALDLMEKAAAASPTADRIERLAWAHQAAGLIRAGLLEPEKAIHHFNLQIACIERLQKMETANQRIASILKNAARGNIAESLVRLGRTEEALTNFFLPMLLETVPQAIDPHTSDRQKVWLLKMAHENVGMAYYKLGRFADAIPDLRESLRAMEALHQRNPHSAQYSSVLALLRAELGETLLCVYQQEGLDLLRGAFRDSENLIARDPSNAGFQQVQIEVLWRTASGLASWAAQADAPFAERQVRIEQAAEHLQKAMTVAAALKSISLRRYVGADLDGISRKIAEAKTKLRTPTSQLDHPPP